MPDANPQRNPPNRCAVAGLALLIFACLLSTAREVMQAPSLTPQRAATDEVSARSDRRFYELRKALPETGIVGYIGEAGPAATPDYYLTQYAVAPLVVVQSTDHPFVIGNFPSSPQPAIPNELAAQFRLVRDFGNGVMLFAKRDSH